MNSNNIVPRAVARACCTCQGTGRVLRRENRPRAYYLVNEAWIEKGMFLILFLSAHPTLRLLLVFEEISSKTWQVRQRTLALLCTGKLLFGPVHLSGVIAREEMLRNRAACVRGALPRYRPLLPPRQLLSCWSCVRPTVCDDITSYACLKPKR